MPVIELKDLIVECEVCNQTGYDPSSAASRIKPAFPDFGVRPGGMAERCEHCKGKGATLTSTGEAIRDFISWLAHTGQIRISQ